VAARRGRWRALLVALRGCALSVSGADAARVRVGAGVAAAARRHRHDAVRVERRQAGRHRHAHRCALWAARRRAVAQTRFLRLCTRALTLLSASRPQGRGRPGRRHGAVGRRGRRRGLHANLRNRRPRCGRKAVLRARSLACLLCLCADARRLRLQAR
jgi:hypothetical protein